MGVAPPVRACASTRARVHTLLERLRVRVGEDPQPDRVQVAPPEAIRARRFEAVFVCGLQEGEFPRPAAPEPFLPDEDRRELAAASGLRLPLREDQLDRERYLFYVCASRAERLLVLSARTSDEEGDPQAASFFLEDVHDALGPLPERRRSLSDVTWDPELAPTHGRVGARARAARAAARAAAAGAADRRARARAAGRARDRLRGGAGALRRLPGEVARRRPAQAAGARARSRAAGARQLRPRGARAHLHARLREQTGSGRVTPETLPLAERILLEQLQASRGEFQLSPQQTRVRAALRRLEFDLLRYLRHDAATDGEFEPEHFELRFGGPGRGAGRGRRRPARARQDRPRRRLGRPRARARLQERQARRELQGRQLGVREPPPGRALHARRRAAARPAPRRRRVRAARRRGSPAARHGAAPSCRSWARTSSTTTASTSRSSTRCSSAPASASPRPPSACAAGGCARRRTPAPGTAAARTPRSAAARSEDGGLDRRAARRGASMPTLTDEQRAAVELRDGSLLVRAGAGAGKTSVLVERFVRAVTEDEVPVDGILAITFTEKAAQEMRRRVRTRLLELGQRERGARRRAGLDLDDPRLLLAPAARARARRRHRPRVPRAGRARGRADRARRLRRRARGLPRRRRRPRAAWRWSPPTRPTACARWCAPSTRGCAAAASAGPCSSPCSRRWWATSASG